MNFFKTMVVMGSGLALGCGGVTTEHDKEPEPGSSSGSGGSSSTSGSTGSSNTGSGGFSSTGGSTTTGSGGTISVPSGGSSATGSGGFIDPGGTGGTAAGGSGGLVEPPPCPPEQWECLSATCGTQSASGEWGWSVPQDCTCNPNRPLSPSDCEADSHFVCNKGTTDQNGIPVSHYLPFQCTCVLARESCSQDCAWAYGNTNYECSTISTTPESILCGCAVIVLK